MYHGANTIFLLAQNLNAYMKLKNIYDSEKIWQKLDNYYTLEISPNIRNSEEKQILETNIYNLIKKSEQHGGLLLKNNNIANPDKTITFLKMAMSFYQ